MSDTLLNQDQSQPQVAPNNSWARNLLTFGAGMGQAIAQRTADGHLVGGTGLGGLAYGLSGGIQNMQQDQANVAITQAKLGEVGARTGLMGQQTQAAALQNRYNTMLMGMRARAMADPNFMGMLGGGGVPPLVENQQGPDLTGSNGPLRERLGQVESGGNYNPPPNKLGYLGKYQMGAAALANAGLYTPAQGEDLTQNQWKGTFNIPGSNVQNVQDFLKNPDAQEAAFDTYSNHLGQQIAQAGIPQFYGQKIGGIPMTQDNAFAIAHIGGLTGLQKFVQSGGTYNPADANGTTLTGYVRKAQLAGGGQQQPGPQQAGQQQPYQVASSGGNIAPPPMPAQPQQPPQQQQGGPQIPQQNIVDPQRAITHAQQLRAQAQRLEIMGMPGADVMRQQAQQEESYGLGLMKEYGQPRTLRGPGSVLIQPGQPPLAVPIPRNEVDPATGNKSTVMTDPLTGRPIDQGFLSQLGPQQEETLKTRGEISRGDLNHDRKTIEEDLAHAIDNAQPAQAQLLQLRDLASRTPSGAGGEFRTGVKNWLQTYLPEAWTKDLDTATSQEFIKSAFGNTASAERAAMGLRGGYGALKMFQNANPNIELQPQANIYMSNALLVSHQRDVDYTQGAAQWYNTNKDRLAQTGEYQALPKYDQQFMSTMTPELYFSAIQAVNGKSYEEWSKGLKPAQQKIVAGIVQRADPNAKIRVQYRGQEGLMPVGSMDGMGPQDLIR